MKGKYKVIQVREYIKLMRIKHYLKNLLIFIPILVNGQLSKLNNLPEIIIGFISFCLLSSAIYCYNDIKDVKKDKEHSIKKHRPIASEKISTQNAFIFMIVLLIIAIFLNFFCFRLNTKTISILILLELIYLFINIAYSSGLKKIPILDVTILMLGFIIRLVYGAQIASIEISNWLYLTIMTGSLYMGFGKRRNEIIKQGDKSREVLKKYNKEFLDKFMYVCLILIIVFYCLWCIDINTISRIGNNYIIWTIPLVLIILMKYSLDIEMDSYGDPVDVITNDKILIALLMLYIIFFIGILYFF